MKQFQNLDVKGDIRTHPFAELLAEIHQNRLSGSLRLATADKKGVIYFRDGEVVYGATNARDFRLFNLLLLEKKIEQKTLAQFSDLGNDFELAARLVAKKLLTKEEMDGIIMRQVEAAIADALKWPYGAWHFSPLTRLRPDMTYKIDARKLLIQYARDISSDSVGRRLQNVPEAFGRSELPVPDDVLQGHETYALDQFQNTDLRIDELCSICRLPIPGTLQALYVLWLGGLVLRKDWNGAFSVEKLEEIRTAKIALIKEAVKSAADEVKSEEAAPEPEVVPEISISLEEYLERVEKADTLYEILGVNQRAPLYEIKNAYFAMAKLFHPDRYHREEATKLRQIQSAFTEIAHAYETLKTEDSRESYNLKMTKEAEFKKKKREAAEKEISPEQRQVEQGLESFELALEAFNEEEYAAAAGHFARAVHYSPHNALYHAYFGKALSQLERQHHKAEASLQTAIKLDPANPKIRMMLVEFFVDMKMTKRAIGELNRFLEMAPDNKEAAKMLAKLQPPVEVQ